MVNQSRTRKISLLAAGLLTLAAPSAEARHLVKKCASLEVRSITTSLKLVHDMALDAQQETVETLDAGTQAQNIVVVARGPILGSMDSETLKTDLACSSDGLVITATITRSANYHGAVLQNQLWFPQITIMVVPLMSKMSVQAIWRMRLTNGKSVDRSRTPPYPERKYPITVTREFHARRR